MQLTGLPTTCKLRPYGQLPLHFVWNSLVAFLSSYRTGYCRSTGGRKIVCKRELPLDGKINI